LREPFLLDYAEISQKVVFADLLKAAAAVVPANGVIH